MNELIPFGKYKGQPIESIQQDTQYCDWLMAQDWFRDRHNKMYQIIINNFGEPSETPEHNKLQALFVSHDNCCKLATHIGYWWVKEDSKKALSAMVAHYQDEINKEKETPNRSYFLDNYELALYDFNKALESNEQVKTIRSFEEYGWDVYIEIVLSRIRLDIGVELKPSIGDDYPAILRQIKANCSRLKATYNHPREVVLCYSDFNAVGADEDTVREIFKSSNITLVRLDEFMGNEL